MDKKRRNLWTGNYQNINIQYFLVKDTVNKNKVHIEYSSTK